MMRKEKVSSRDIKHIAAQYDGKIRYFDSELRILFKNIESFGMLKDSIIIFTADHGEEFFEHVKLLHGYTLYQEQLRVPLIIMGKNIPIRKISQPVSLIDLLPTLLNLSGIKEKIQFQGRNILIKQKSMNFYPLYAEASLNAVFTIKYKSVIKNGWKYIYDVLDNSEELYNLGEDPEEKINLVSKKTPQLDQLRKQMKKFIRSTTKSSGQALTPIDEKTREQLKTLGYIK
jgi:arylsulfatase A-like enzyme